MRIAWLGPAHSGGGVPGMGRSLLTHLLQHGVEIDYFTINNEACEILGESELLQIVHHRNWWQWNRWYSRKPFLAFFSGIIARGQGHRKLCDMIAEHHVVRRYDCVMQFSQMELLRLKKYLDRLPPVVVYPCVHAAGELTWHTKESAYARASEGNLRYYVVRLFLIYRTFLQRRQSHLPAMMIGMSKRFNELMELDYGLPASRLRVLYHPIDPAPASVIEPIGNRKVRIIFAGRISVRKGTEMVIELSKRLDDLADQIEIEVIGGHTQWSDYRKHMTKLNPRVAKYLGGQNNDKLMQTFERSDILITPSHYEPGGLVVGEAISRGMCVVATDEVGSAEPLEGPFIIKFKSGEMDAFERSVRDMIERVKTNRSALAQSAREAATQQFLPTKIAGELVSLLKEAAAM